MSNRIHNLTLALLAAGAVALGLTGATANADTIYVPEDYPTIQEALDVAVSGDEVSVATGVYHENVSFASDGVMLRSRLPHLATIDGGGSGHVVTCNTYSATIDGFVITGSGGTFHAGVFTSQASQVIRNNIITGNNGHGIVISSGSVAQIVNNVIMNNSSWHAGIKSMTGASATIANNCVAGNRYGLYASSSGALRVVNNTVVDHVKWSLYFGGTAAAVTNNVLANAEIGILFAGPFHEDIDYLVSQYLTISYNDVWQNSEYDYYAELGGIPDFNAGPFTPLPGTGEISVDPLLAGAGDYRLQSSSPCIDAGCNWAVPPDTADLDNDADTEEPTPLDLDGEGRFFDDPNTPDTGCGCPPVVDMGAYEFGDTGPQPCPGDLDCDRVVGHSDLGIVLSAWLWSDEGDLNCDGDTDHADLGILLAHWGEGCP